MKKRTLFILLLICLFWQYLKGQSFNSGFDLSNDSTITYFKKLLNKSKNSSFAQYGLAATYFAKKDYANALLYSKINLKAKNDFDTACQLIYACSLDRMERTLEAIEAFEDGLKKYPEDISLWSHYALSSYKIRDHKKAQYAIKKSISLNQYFPGQHYLLACSMFENSNDANCIYPVFYGLMLDSDSVRATNAILFLSAILNKKQSQVNIPFFENRMAVTSIDDILLHYFPVKTKWEIIENMQPFDLYNTIEMSFLKKEVKKDDFYYEFNSTIQSNQLLEPYIYYCLRALGNEYVKIWYKSHPEQLNAFAEFLDKNLKAR